MCLCVLLCHIRVSKSVAVSWLPRFLVICFLDYPGFSLYATKSLLNIIQNFIPHETVICDDRDPPWINKEIKKLMLEKNLAFKSYCHSNESMFLFEKFKALQYQLNISIEESKEKYCTKLSSRLADPLTSPKTYWSILKTFLTKKFLASLLFFMKTSLSRTESWII